MIFKKKDESPKIGFNVGVLLRKKETKGDIGIEIEVEGKKLPDPATIPPPWKFHVDGSLRGEENAEYVLDGPVVFDDVPKTLEALWARFKECGSRIDDSNRTSVHVHLNCQKFHLNRLTSFVALYFAFEEVITHWCGEHRVGNLFCLRAVDAPAIVRQMKFFIQRDGSYQLNDNLHYAGLNANALQKFGSLEVRTLRGVKDSQTIIEWINILRRFYDLSAEFTDPRDIPGMFSGMGPMGFFSEILGDNANVVMRDVNLSTSDIQDMMHRGIRLAQDLCYCRDWDIFKPMDLNADPFGRDARSILKKLQQPAPTPSLAEVMANEGPDYDPEDYYIEVEVDDFPAPSMAPAPVHAPQTVSLNVLQSGWAAAVGDSLFSPNF